MNTRDNYEGKIEIDRNKVNSEMREIKIKVRGVITCSIRGLL